MDWWCKNCGDRWFSGADEVSCSTCGSWDVVCEDDEDYEEEE